MRKRTAAALLATVAAALAWRPSRYWLADVMSVTAHHLDHGPDVPPSPAAIARGQRTFAAHVADALVRRGADARDSAGRNGKSSWPV